MLGCVAGLIQAMTGPDIIVRFAHMELAPPAVGEAFDECVRSGADDVVVFPYMLSPGRHSTADIPRMVGEAAQRHPGITYSVTSAFGVHEKLAEVVLARAGIAPRPLTDAEADRCWDPNCSGTACGDACRARQDRTASAAETSVSHQG